MQSPLHILLSFCFVLSEGQIFDLQVVVCHILEEKLVLVLLDVLWFSVHAGPFTGGTQVLDYSLLVERTMGVGKG